MVDSAIPSIFYLRAIVCGHQEVKVCTFPTPAERRVIQKETTRLVEISQFSVDSVVDGVPGNNDIGSCFDLAFIRRQVYALVSIGQDRHHQIEEHNHGNEKEHDVQQRSPDG